MVSQKVQPAFQTPAKVLNRGFILICIANLLHNFGQQTVSTLVPRYANALGATSTLVGVVAGVFAISSFVIKPIASPAFDCKSKRVLYVLSNAVILASYFLFFFAPDVNWLIAGRLIQGIGIGIAAPVGLSIACDNLPDGSFARGVSIYSLGQAFGQAIGPGIGLYLVDVIGYKSTFGVCILFMVGTCVAGMLTRGRDPLPDAKYRIRLSGIVAKEALPASIPMIFIVAAYACIGGFLVIYGDLLGVTQIGLYFTVYAVFLLIVRVLTKGLADKFGYVKVLIPSLACFACAFLLFGGAHALPAFLIAAVFSALGYGVCQPNLQAQCMAAVSPGRRGTASNTVYICQDIGTLLGPLIAGAYADSLVAKGLEGGMELAQAQIAAYSGMYTALIGSLAIAAVLILLLNRRARV